MVKSGNKSTFLSQEFHGLGYKKLESLTPKKSLLPAMSSGFDKSVTRPPLLCDLDKNQKVSMVSRKV